MGLKDIVTITTGVLQVVLASLMGEWVEMKPEIKKYRARQGSRPLEICLHLLLRITEL